jgi:hypothetical protein
MKTRDKAAAAFQGKVFDSHMHYERGVRGLFGKYSRFTWACLMLIFSGLAACGTGARSTQLNGLTEKQQFGILIYTIPAGWEQRSTSDRIELAPKNRSVSADARIHIQRDEPIDGDLANWVEARMGQVVGNGRIVWQDPNGPRRISYPGFEGYGRRVTIQTSQGIGIGTIIVGFKSHDRGALIVAQVNSPDALKKYSGDIDKLVDGVAFANQGGIESHEVVMDREIPRDEPILRIEAGGQLGYTVIATDSSGEHLVSASSDKTVRLWKVQTGELVNVFRVPITQGLEGSITAVALSPNGRRIVCGGFLGQWRRQSQSASLYVFDTETGRLSTPITDLTNTAKWLAFTGDGEYLVVLLHEI